MNTRRALVRAVGWFEVTTGILSAIGMGSAMLLSLPSWEMTLRSGAGLPFCALVIVAGFRLLEGRPFGLAFSLAAQLLQLVHFSTGSVGFWAVAGFSIQVGVEKGRFSVGGIAGNLFQVSFGPQDPVFLVNALAAACLVVLIQEYLRTVGRPSSGPSGP